jgi:hypothetical protein
MGPGRAGRSSGGRAHDYCSVCIIGNCSHLSRCRCLTTIPPERAVPALGACRAALVSARSYAVASPLLSLSKYPTRFPLLSPKIPPSFSLFTDGCVRACHQWFLMELSDRPGNSLLISVQRDPYRCPLMPNKLGLLS